MQKTNWKTVGDIARQGNALRNTRNRKRHTAQGEALAMLLLMIAVFIFFAWAL